VATDHVPFIGRSAPSAARRWVTTAFGKWGMTNGYVAARIIGDAIDEKDPAPWAATFDSTRIRSTVNGELVKAGVNAMHHIVGDRVARRSEPRCTHQGCVLRKDDALNTWDCPCHGSRFDDKGEVLQGPALKAIKTP
jgi:nitrite reductase/ring-hydroxylating ferredoxin subunit